MAGEPAGVYQFGVREAIEAEEGCSYKEAHALRVRLHNDLVAAFEEQKRDLMTFATPELTLYLVGLEAWAAGPYRTVEPRGWPG